MESKTLKVILAAVVMVTSGPVLQARASGGIPAEQQEFIRTAIFKDAGDFSVSLKGRYKFVDPRTGRILSEGRTLKKSTVKPASTGIQVGPTLLPAGTIRLIAKKDIVLYAEGRASRYRGSIDIHLEKGKFLVVNNVELETYVRGVLYHEVSHRWPLEAIKAQAVAVRTYALYQMKVNRDQKYDVTSNIYSQVYGGRSAERFRTNLAVGRTKGEILMFKGEVLPSYYHAACGGYTEDAGALWNHDLLPLKGGPCEFCAASAHNTWQRNFRSKDIQETLNQNGYNLGLIEDIKILERNRSGRILNLQITARDGQKTIVTGKKFRDIIGPNKIKSNKYRIEMKGYYFDLIGQGWGHGVGLCQWGAFEMSRRRWSYPDILRYYYPGAELTNYSK